MFKRVLTSAAVIAAVLSTTTPAKADFIIDTFTSPNPATTYTLGTTTGSVFNSSPSKVGPGVTRTIEVTQVGNATIAAGGFYGNSAIDFAAFQLNTSNTSFGSASYAEPTYAYASDQNLDAGGPVLRFSFDALQTSAPFSVVLSDGTTSATRTGLVNASSSSTNIAIPPSTFIGTNLTAITPVSLYVNRNATATPNFSAPDADITIRDIRVSQDIPPVVPVVPAPPAAILLLAAAPAFGLVRFGRRKLGM
jgi:hypothetical protein